MSILLILIAIEVCTLLFAYCCGRHDVAAVDNFTFWGSNPKQQKQFHSYNWKMKFFYIVAIGLATLNLGTSTALLLALCNFIIIWAVFDPTVAIFRTVYDKTNPKKPWYYLSDKSNKVDAALIDLLGKKAGLYKFYICIAILITLNIFML